jgi:15-cis-phytoene synthase
MALIANVVADVAACTPIVRQMDIDRYYSSLFAPSRHSPALLALYAFNIEIAQVRERVSDPLPGEVRLQWWRDILEGAAAQDDDAAPGHPVAAALLRAIRKYSLPVAPLLDLIDARVFDLYDDPMPSMADLEGYAGETSSALMRLASLVLAEGDDPGPADASGHGGVAYAITGLLRALPLHSARGQVYLPGDILERHGVTREMLLARKNTPGLDAALAELRAEARRHLTLMAAVSGDVPEAVRPAILPASLCEAYLRQMEQAGYDPFRSAIDRAPLAKLWALWRAS